jgi:glutathione peroxidase
LHGSSCAPFHIDPLVKSSPARAFIMEMLEGEIMSASVLDIPVKKITGEDTSLAEFKGHVLLVVNVASKCGLTPQYEGLEKIYEQYKGQGLVVAGFPANDFKAQEPGTNEEIQTFCTTNYGVKFPLFDKITVVGPEKHPLYKALIAEQPKAVSVSAVPFREKLKGYGIDGNPDPEVLWNFEKFLVSRSGKVVERFAPDTQPDAPELKAAIEAELKKS